MKSFCKFKAGPSLGLTGLKLAGGASGEGEGGAGGKGKGKPPGYLEKEGWGGMPEGHVVQDSTYE